MRNEEARGSAPHHSIISLPLGFTISLAAQTINADTTQGATAALYARYRPDDPAPSGTEFSDAIIVIPISTAST